MSKLSLVLVLIIGVLSTATVFAWQSRGVWFDPESARNAAIDYVLLKYDALKGLRIPSSWETRSLAADPPIPGLDAWQYIGDAWTVNVTYPVVPNPTYTVKIEYKGDINFRWEGTVDQDGNVDEMHFVVEEGEATITGEYLPVGNPCTTTPCLPGIVYAVFADGKYYYLTVEGYWIWENRPWDGYMPTEGDHVKVTGYVSKRLDVNGNRFYEIEVVSLIEYTEEYFSEFRVVVNGVRELDVLVHVNVTDGLTREEAEQIAEATFVQVMGEKVMQRLDTLTLDENSMEAHYTWGLDESDMAHIFDMTVDSASRLITVTHCR
jgi:hypothetical protein